MTKQAPSAARILTMLAFAGSCVGLLIFLWISFGGATPFAPEGYRVNAEFNQAIEDYRAWLTPQFPTEVKRGQAEFYYNSVQAFLHAIIIYMFALVLAGAALLSMGAAPTITIMVSSINGRFINLFIR